MFLKIRYTIILLCILEFYIGLCKNENLNELKNWRLEEKRAIDSKNKNYISKNDKSARVNLMKHKEKKGGSNLKWPKLQRKDRERNTERYTKLQMMQETEETTHHNHPLDDVETTPHIFSTYSIKHELAQIVANIPDSNATLEIIGRTVEYQDIVMVRITESKDATKYFRADDHKYAVEKPEKKIIFIVHGLSVLGIENLPSLIYSDTFELLLSYYTSHLDKFDIFLIPIANPDGFAYVMSKTTPQYYNVWDKNVAPQSECPGVALDRNFDVAWVTNRTIGSCSQLYPGPSPFSEAETRAIRDIFHKYAHKIVAYFNVHASSYHFKIQRGDAVLYPKGYSDSTDSDDKYIDLKGEIDEALRNASFLIYSVAVDTLYNWYGQVHGSSVDYASTVYGIPYAMELVMQHYYDTDISDNLTELSLTDVWKRVIDVILNYIHKSLHSNDVR